MWYLITITFFKAKIDPQHCSNCSQQYPLPIHYLPCKESLPVCLINVIINFYVFTYYTPYTYFTYHLELQDSANSKGHFALYSCLVLGTPSTVVFRGLTAIRFLQNRFMEVIAWTSSWFCHRASTIEPSLCGIYSCSQHLLQRTLDPSPSIVHWFRCGNPTTILRMVIITIMTIICIKPNKTYYDIYSHQNNV